MLLFRRSPSPFEDRYSSSYEIIKKLKIPFTDIFFMTEVAVIFIFILLVMLFMKQECTWL